MRTMIVVAEKEIRETLTKNLLYMVPAVSMVGVAGNVTEGLACFMDENFETPDIIFCSGSFADGTFIDLFSNVYDPYPVVWLSEKEIIPPAGLLSVTVDRIKGRPGPELLLRAINRYSVLKRLMTGTGNHAVAYNINHSRMAGWNRSERKKAVIVKKDNSLRKLLIADIACIFLWSRVTVVLSKEGERFLGLANLTGFEKTLPGETFFRVTRTMIINIELMDSFRTLRDGRIRVQLKKGDATGAVLQVLVSKENAPAFRKWAGL